MLVLQIKHSKVDKLSIPTLKGFEMVAVNDILYLESDGNYTSLHLEGGGRIVSTRNIGYYDEEFTEEPFLRVHQSFLVNLNRIKSYVKADNGYVVMENGTPIQVARSKKEDLIVFFRMRRVTNNRPNRPEGRPFPPDIQRSRQVMGETDTFDIKAAKE